MIEFRVRDYPGLDRSFEFELSGLTPEALQPSLPLLLDSLAALRELVEPLACSLSLASVDSTGEFHIGRSERLRDWVLEGDLPEHIKRPVSDWPLSTRVPTITSEALGAWLETALAEPSPPGMVTCWYRLSSDRTRMRVPGQVAASADAVRLAGSSIEVPIERREDGSAWLAGAIGATDEPPVHMQVDIDHGVMSLSLAICWSIWADADSPGRVLIERAAAKLIALGWTDLGFDDEDESPILSMPMPPARAASGEATVDGGRIMLGPPLYSGAGDQVRLGWLADDLARRFLVTLTPEHVRQRAELQRELAIDVAGISPLDAIVTPDPPLRFEDALVELLPEGNPVAEHSLVDEAQIIRIGIQLARVLERVHAMGTVLHGVRPELIYVTDDADGLTVTGLVPRGVPFIMSSPQPLPGARSYWVPYVGYEGLVQGTAEARSDVFALCATLFVVATGKHPFGNPQRMGELIDRVTSDRPEPWQGSAALGKVLRRGLAARPASRPSAGELAEQLSALAGTRAGF